MVLIALVLGISICLVGAQIFLKLALGFAGERAPKEASLPRQIGALLLTPHFFASTIALLIGVFLWLFLVTSGAELSFVYPLLSVSYVLMMVVAHFVFGETITMKKLFGTLVICLGIVVLLWKG